MAGNFWQSSHYQQWLLDKQDLIRERQGDIEILTEDEYQKLLIFFANWIFNPSIDQSSRVTVGHSSCLVAYLVEIFTFPHIVIPDNYRYALFAFIQTLGEQLKVRQQVVATATVYFKRFYSRNSLKCIEPLLLAPTCIFLASKVEEFGVISNTRLISTCQTVVKNKFAHAFVQDFPYRMQHVLECEFYLLEMMDCCLVLYQPYRPLVTYVQDLGHEDTILPLGWRIVNDSLRTDVCLLYPPYLIALACINMACVILQKDCKQWFAELNVDMEKILEITRYILNLYELWKTFDEKKEIQGLLTKMPKAKSQPPGPTGHDRNGSDQHGTEHNSQQSQAVSVGGSSGQP